MESLALATRLLVLCGLAAAIVFIGTDLVSGSLWHGYDYVVRSISQLSATGSPVRPFAAPLFALVNVLTIAFGIGIWRWASSDHWLRTMALIVVANGAFALAAAFFPNHVGVTPRFLSPGVLLAAASVVCIVLAIGVSVFAVGGWLRVYSIATLLAYTVLTIVGYASQMEPRIGLQERLMAYTWVVWLALFATTLLADGTQAFEAAG